MAQWTRIEKFVNQTRQYITCEKSECLHPVEPGLTAGRQVDEIWARLDIYKLAIDLNIRFFALFNLYCIVSTFLMHLYRQTLLQGCFIECGILRILMILYWSLLYSTTVLYDRPIYVGIYVRTKIHLHINCQYFSFLALPCPLLGDPNNGMINCSLGDDGVLSYGDTCSFMCDIGYELTGSGTRTCHSNGSWSGSVATCSRSE